MLIIYLEFCELNKFFLYQILKIKSLAYFAN